MTKVTRQQVRAVSKAFGFRAEVYLGYTLLCLPNDLWKITNSYEARFKRFKTREEAREYIRFQSQEAECLRTQF